MAAKKKTGLLKALSVIILIGGGALVGYTIGQLIPADSGGYLKELKTLYPQLPLLTLLSLPLFYLFVVGVHEMGHVIAGRSVNFGFQAFLIGPFKWEKDGERIRFGWNKSLNLSGGLALMLPKDQVRLRQRFMWFAAGGPIASLLLAALCWIVAMFLPELSIVRFLLQVISFFSAMILLVTIIPMQGGGFKTDGKRIVDLMKKGPDTDAEVCMLAALSTLRAGIRPRNLDIQGLEVNYQQKEEPDVIKSSLAYYCYVYYMDQGELVLAKDYLEKYLALRENYPLALQDSVWLDPAFFSAYFEKDLEQAEQYYQQFKKAPFVSQVNIDKLEAAIALLKGEHELAKEKLEAARKNLPGLIMKGFKSMYEEWFADIENQLSHRN